MSALNCLSKNIHIFPISFDRSQVGGTTQYWIRNDTSYTGDNADDKKYLEENLVLSEAPDTKYSTFYVQSNTTAALSNSYSNGRSLSEKNISSLINALTTEHNFVVGADISIDNKCNSIEFIIKGRYFALNFDSGDSNFSTEVYNKDLWVGVKFRDTNSIETDIDEFETLYAYDNSVNIAESGAAPNYIDKLEQVDFFTEEPASWSNYSEHLQLLEKLADGSVRVPIASKFRFDDTAVSHINGGTV